MDGDDDVALRYYILNERTLDGRLEDLADTTILDADGKVRGVINGASEMPWGGRGRETCSFQLGQLVAFVSGDSYRTGVVNGLPMSPEEVSRCGGVTLADDLYLIGMLDSNGSTEANAHEHIPEPLLFAIEHEVAPELREALKRRHEGDPRPASS